MNHYKFFVYQVLLSFLTIANNVLFSEILNGFNFFNNRFISALIKVPIDMILLYFIFTLYGSLKTKLRYKVLIHISAIIVGAVLLGIIGSFIGL